MTKTTTAARTPEVDALAELWTTRASRRAFHPDPISRTELTTLFSAAQHAPSWCNVQPWRVVVTEPPLISVVPVPVAKLAPLIVPLNVSVPLPIKLIAPNA